MRKIMKKKLKNQNLPISSPIGSPDNAILTDDAPSIRAGAETCAEDNRFPAQGTDPGQG